jgi:hypothetical protein
MIQRFKRFFVLANIFLLYPMLSYSAVNLPWSTTFNYPECAQRGGGGATDCDKVKNDGITWSYGSGVVDGNYTQVKSGANNPTGSGGNGYRTWVADEHNVGSGPVAVQFPSPQKELWIRWYMRYQPGFNWDKLSYDKMLYIHTGGSSKDAIPEWTSGGYAVIAQGSPNYHQLHNYDYGWADVMGGSASDGQWHMFEVYLKMDSGGYTGRGRFWIDGVLRGENLAMNWSGDNSTAQQGWTYFHFHSNQSLVNNGGAAYVDYDDIAVYNSIPPSVDAHGNPFIGPVGGSDTAPSPSEPPSTPKNLRITSN